MSQKLGQAAVLSAEQWARLEKYANPTHRLIWALCRFTAARISEALRLTVGDVYRDPAKREHFPEIVYPREIRKGRDKNHPVPVSSALSIYLKAYTPSLASDDWLFPGQKGNHLSYEAAIKYLQSCRNKAGLHNLKISTHSGRRSCLTELARNGTNIRVIQSISGHASLSNLQRYIEVDPKQKINALEGIFS
ncbi:tyrosine-type recombinase/integrase [Pannus brasiliensis CCIBt3594]|uniref:Tyrosine-type recombinase/integrase n=1 Tax=Pannus brasiliensis CCIBt3594 TaxID=1427578 RepID=A0AAW9QP52_9CHRO